MSISVLIVSYGVRERLRRCLDALGTAAEVVVVDNASPDGSAELVRREYPHVRLIAWPENRGFARAVNAAAGAASGDTFLLLNPDAVASAAELERMRQALERLPDAGAIGFRQVDEQGLLQLTVGPPPSLLLELVRRFVQRRLDRGDARLARALDRWLSRPRRVPWVAGSAVLVPRERFAAIGGFDERFFLYFEDIDFCLRLREAGAPIYYDPTVTVVHVRGESARRAPAVARAAYRDSQLLYWQKHRGPLARGVVRAYQLLWRPS